MPNVILTGYMGTGKSSVGKALARQTGLRYIDLDALIVAEAGRPITEIFADEGEASFRARESGALCSLVDREGFILSTGGGAVIAAANRQIIHALGQVVNLTASVASICARLRHADDRPLLADGVTTERVERMLREREVYYADADIRIDTTGKKVEDVAFEIRSILGL